MLERERAGEKEREGGAAGSPVSPLGGQQVGNVAAKKKLVFGVTGCMFLKIFMDS